MLSKRRSEGKPARSADTLVANAITIANMDIATATFEWIQAQGDAEAQLRGLQELFNMAETRTDVIGEIITEAWVIFLTSGIWKAKYETRAEAERALDTPLLRDIRLRAASGRRRKDKAINVLHANWGEAIVGMDLKRYGETRLAAMAAVSKTHGTKDALRIVISIMMSRLGEARPGRGSSRQITTGDWQALERMGDEEIGAILAKPAALEEELRAYEIDITQLGLTPAALDDGGPAKGVKRRRYTRPPREEEVTEADSDTSMGVSPAGSDESDEFPDNEDDADESGSDGDKLGRAGLTGEKPRCKCTNYPAALLHRISRSSPVAAGIANDAAWLEILSSLLKTNGGRVDFKDVCAYHIRRLAAHGGLQVKSLDKEGCQKRVMECWTHRGGLAAFKARQETTNWWRFTGRGWTEADDHGVYAQRPVRRSLIMKVPQTRKEAIIDEICVGGWLVWEETGNIIVRGMFSWIWEGLTVDGEHEPGVGSLIDTEFDLYLFHQCERNGAPNKGWLRTMFYSLSQQLIRQDLAYWMLYACLRPDGNIRLVSYPYYAKFAKGGDATFFRHIDMNIPQYLESGRGKDIIQGSVSFDDESEFGCTELVLGFHHHIAEWWGKVVARGAATAGYVHGMEKLWTAEDTEEYGDFEPVPCGRGDVRVTMPEIPHGSTRTSGASNGRRRTILPWFVGLNEDGRTLDTEESETWGELAAAHTSQTAPRKTPSGLSNKYGPIPYKFPPSTQLSIESPVSKALVCAATWEDPVVQVHANILLGADRAAAWAAIQQQRVGGLRAFRRAFGYVKAAEQAYYGSQSFFREKGS